MHIILIVLETKENGEEMVCHLGVFFSVGRHQVRYLQHLPDESFKGQQ